jgi:hypothetical protein
MLSGLSCFKLLMHVYDVTCKTLIHTCAYMYSCACGVCVLLNNKQSHISQPEAKPGVTLEYAEEGEDGKNIIDAIKEEL